VQKRFVCSDNAPLAPFKSGAHIEAAFVRQHFLRNNATNPKSMYRRPPMFGVAR
jgi:hypothetical protein